MIEAFMGHLSYVPSLFSSRLKTSTCPRGARLALDREAHISKQWAPRPGLKPHLSCTFQEALKYQLIWFTALPGPIPMFAFTDKNEFQGRGEEISSNFSMFPTISLHSPLIVVGEAAHQYFSSPHGQQDSYRSFSHRLAFVGSWLSIHRGPSVPGPSSPHQAVAQYSVLLFPS